MAAERNPTGGKMSGRQGGRPGRRARWVLAIADWWQMEPDPATRKAPNPTPLLYVKEYINTHAAAGVHRNQIDERYRTILRAGGPWLWGMYRILCRYAADRETLRGYLVTLQGQPAGPDAIAETIPHVTAAEVRKALKQLQKVGALVREPYERAWNLERAGRTIAEQDGTRARPESQPEQTHDQDAGDDAERTTRRAGMAREHPPPTPEREHPPPDANDRGAGAKAGANPERNNNSNMNPAVPSDGGNGQPAAQNSKANGEPRARERATWTATPLADGGVEIGRGDEAFDRPDPMGPTDSDQVHAVMHAGDGPMPRGPAGLENLNPEPDEPDEPDGPGGRVENRLVKSLDAIYDRQAQQFSREVWDAMGLPDAADSQTARQHLGQFASFWCGVQRAGLAPSAMQDLWAKAVREARKQGNRQRRGRAFRRGPGAVWWAVMTARLEHMQQEKCTCPPE